MGGLSCSAVLAKERFIKADIAKTPTVTAATTANGCAFAVVWPFATRVVRDLRFRRPAVIVCTQCGAHDIKDNPRNIAAHNERSTLTFVPSRFVQIPLVRSRRRVAFARLRFQCISNEGLTSSPAVLQRPLGGQVSAQLTRPRPRPAMSALRRDRKSGTVLARLASRPKSGPRE